MGIFQQTSLKVIMKSSIFLIFITAFTLSDLRSVLNLKAVVAPCLERMINLNLGQKKQHRHRSFPRPGLLPKTDKNGIVTLLSIVQVAYNPVSMQYIIVTVHIVKLPQVLSPLPCASHIYVSCITAQHIYTRNRGLGPNRMWVSNIQIQRAGQTTQRVSTNI